MTLLRYVKHRLDIFLFISTIILLTLGFNNNLYKAAYDYWYDNFQKGMESFVLWKIVVSEKDGIFAEGGFTGTFKSAEGSYKTYTENLKIQNPKYSPYLSQSGGQAIIFSLLNKISPFEKSINLELFWLLTSILSSIIFTSFLLWAKNHFGYLTSFIGLLFILNAGWITVFAKNLWWSLWSFYLPFIVLLFMLQNESKQKKHSLNKIFFIAYLFLLIKCFFTGFEYITTSLIMTGIPFVFYAIFNTWSIKLIVKRLLIYSISAVSAVFTAVLALMLQISVLKENFSSGYNHIVFSFFKRTHNSTVNLEFLEGTKQSLNKNTLDVLVAYFTGTVVRYISFKTLMLAVFLITVTYFILNLKEKINSNIKLKTLILITWASITAPFSWFILFKGHSAIHTHMNYIVWYMPYALFAFLLIAYVISLFLIDIFARIKKIS